MADRWFPDSVVWDRTEQTLVFDGVQFPYALHRCGEVKYTDGFDDVGHLSFTFLAERACKPDGTVIEISDRSSADFGQPFAKSVDCSENPRALRIDGKEFPYLIADGGFIAWRIGSKGIGCRVEVLCNGINVIGVKEWRTS